MTLLFQGVLPKCCDLDPADKNTIYDTDLVENEEEDDSEDEDDDY